MRDITQLTQCAIQTICAILPTFTLNSQYDAQLCIGYVIKTVFLASTRNTDTGTMRKWPAQVGTVVANVGRELSLLKMAIKANADYTVLFFSMERTGAPLPTAGSGAPGVTRNCNSQGTHQLTVIT